MRYHLIILLLRKSLKEPKTTITKNHLITDILTNNTACAITKYAQAKKKKHTHLNEYNMTEGRMRDKKHNFTYFVVWFPFLLILFCLFLQKGHIIDIYVHVHVQLYCI